MEYNEKATNPIKLVGLGIGDGFTNPIVQEATYGEYAYFMGLIDLESKKKVDEYILN
jgi:hypothetical protein